MLKSKWFLFYSLWILAGCAGFPLGNLLGGDAGLPGILGNLLYGFSFGALQGLALLLWRNRLGNWIWIWPLLSSLGFTLGVRLGSRFSHFFSTESVELGILFGIIVGAAIGGMQWLGLRQIGLRSLIWPLVSILAWVAGESVAFAARFDASAVPLVGLVIAALSGLGLLWVFIPARAREPASLPSVEPEQIPHKRYIK